MNSLPTGDRPVVLITGASSGLGAGMAREFAANGYNLALCARRLDALEELSAAIGQSRPDTQVELAKLDVNDHDAVERVFRRFDQQFGRLDRVIVNAGIGTGAPLGKGARAQNIAVVETNFTAAVAQAEAALEIFRHRNAGHLVFISSISAMRGMRGSMAAYAASKAAMAALAEGLQIEMIRKPGIRISTIFPGYIRTEMNADIPRERTPFIIDEKRGCRLLVRAIESERGRSFVPWWPWRPLGWLLRNLPLSLAMRLN